MSADEPMIVSLMRRQPTGEVRYLSDPTSRGMIGTSTKGFLSELDDWLARVKREAAAEAWDKAVKATLDEMAMVPADFDEIVRNPYRAAEIRESK